MFYQRSPNPDPPAENGLLIIDFLMNHYALSYLNRLHSANIQSLEYAGYFYFTFFDSQPIRYYESQIQLRCDRDRSGSCRIHRGIPAGVKRFQSPDSRQKRLPQRKTLWWTFDMENRKATGKHLPNNHRFSEI